MSPMSPRLLRPRATGFSPKQIAGLQAWYDMSDATALGPTHTGVGAVSNNGPVKYVKDKSPAGLHLTQSGADSNSPIYIPKAQNGLSALSFDGGDFLNGSASTMTSAFSLFVVCKANATGTTRVCGVGSNRSIGPFAASNTQWGFFSAGGIVSFGVPATSASVLAMTCSASLAGAFYGNGAQSATGTLASVTPNGFALGGANSGAGDLNGVVYEVVGYSRELTATERQRVEGYLAWKWGLQATLPYDHPYAASFPGYGTQATPSDADALAYLSAVRTADGGTGVEVGVANAVDSFVKGCKSDGIWSAIKASCILAGARTLSGALVPLAGTAPTNNNFVAADYNRKTGLLGNGSTKYLNSNRLDSADALNDVHLSTYVSAVTSAFKMYGGTQSHYIYRDNTDVYFLSRNATAIVGSSGSLTGLYGHSRAASGSFTSRVGGTTNTHSVASGVATGTNVYVFGRNVSDAINSASNARLAFYSIGSSLDLALLDTRVSALYTAIGAAI